MEDPYQYKMKICMVGQQAVGKTSLIKRLAYDYYEDKYVTTIGTKITKKDMLVNYPGTQDEKTVCLLLWDIMGQIDFREILQETYFFGANGLIAVCDVTKPDTLKELPGWISMAQRQTKNIPLVVLGNKCDLTDEACLDLDEVGEFASYYENAEAFITSARTGENVEAAFTKLSEFILESMS
jgi:small GTP-binding protein